MWRESGGRVGGCGVHLAIAQQGDTLPGQPVTLDVDCASCGVQLNTSMPRSWLRRASQARNS